MGIVKLTTCITLLLTCTEVTSHALHREKRYILKFQNVTANSKWPTTIPYELPAGVTPEYQESVESAISAIQRVTCLTFTPSPPATGHRLQMFNAAGAASLPASEYTTDDKPCYTRLGKAPNDVDRTVLVMEETRCYQQTLALMLNALGMPSTAVRRDREEYLNVDTGAVLPEKLPLVAKVAENVADLLTTYNLPYDYNSATHYPANRYGLTATSRVVETKDSRFRRNIGHSTALSFLDGYILNRAYCSGVCASEDILTCENGGYQDPKNCSVCRCPDGWGGVRCETVADSAPLVPTAGQMCSPSSSGSLSVGATEQCVTSPGYDIGSSYTGGFRCNWLLQAPTGCRISMRVENDFNIHCRDRTRFPVCEHWLEFKYRRDPQAPGARACCTDVTFDPVISETNTAAVIFDATFPRAAGAASRGFKMCYKLSDATCTVTTPPSTSASTPTSTSTSASTTATIPTVPTSTTLSTTTPASVTSDCFLYSEWSTCQPVFRTNTCTRSRKQLCYTIDLRTNPHTKHCSTNIENQVRSCARCSCTVCTKHILKQCYTRITVDCCCANSSFDTRVSSVVTSLPNPTCISTSDDDSQHLQQIIDNFTQDQQ